MEHYFTNNQNLKSELRTISFAYQNHDFSFLSDNGIFSKDKIDTGSHLLLDTLIKNETRENLSLLDVGCGYGTLGIIASYCLKSRVTMCDVNKRALHLAELNIEKNKIRGTTIESNCYENITETYDVILTNPPIRAGKEIVLNILTHAKNHLNKNGALWFVIRKDQGAKSLLKVLELEAKCEIFEKSKGFYIMRAEFS